VTSLAKISICWTINNWSASHRQQMPGVFLHCFYPHDTVKRITDVQLNLL